MFYGADNLLLKLRKGTGLKSLLLNLLKLAKQFNDLNEVEKLRISEKNSQRPISGFPVDNFKR